jgi:hypothetical protein
MPQALVRHARNLASVALSAVLFAGVAATPSTSLAFAASPDISRSAQTAIEAPVDTSVAAPSGALGTTATPAAIRYLGRNHFWYPALGISGTVRALRCAAGIVLPRGIYSWGCSGRNNVYLLSHAYDAFRPIFLGYHSGRLRVGQNAWYADASGRVTRYRVAWIKRYSPSAFRLHWRDNATALSRRGITLQTCDNPSGARIIVRLYAG